MECGYQFARNAAPKKIPVNASTLKIGRTRFIAGANKELPMLALYIILGFVAVLAAINFIEFGRVD